MCVSDQYFQCPFEHCAVLREQNIDLPFDEKQMCLFHSEDIEWKVQNNCFERLLEVLAIWDKSEQIESLNCLQVVFVGKDNPEEVRTSIYTDEHGNTTTTKRFERIIDFSQMTFEKSFCAGDGVFIDKTSFFKTQFMREAHFDKAAFKSSVNFSAANFSSRGFFVESHFYGSADFCGAVFAEDPLYQQCCSFALAEFHGWDVIFTQAIFQQVVSFEGTRFLLVKNSIGHYEDAELMFDAVDFLGGCSFKNSVIEMACHFSQACFAQLCEFSNTQFAKDSPLYFERVNIAGQLKFEGTHDNRLLKNVTYLSVNPKKFTGKIYFKNINLSYVPQDLRAELIRLSTTNKEKVFIDSGCIKYRLTYEKTVKTDSDGQNLFVEMARIFVQYFQLFQHKQLGIEITERTTEQLTLLLFSDEDIDQALWLEQIQACEGHFWQQLNSDKADGLSAVPVALSTGETTRWVDLQINLLSFFFKLGFRMKMGKSKQLALGVTLSQAQTDEHQTVMSESQLTQVTQNIYMNLSQTIHGEGNEQSIGLNYKDN